MEMAFKKNDTKNWKQGPEIKSETDKCSFETVQIKSEISVNLLVEIEVREDNDLEKDGLRNKSKSNLETSIDNIDAKNSHGAQVKMFIWFFLQQY